LLEYRFDLNVCINHFSFESWNADSGFHSQGHPLLIQRMCTHTFKHEIRKHKTSDKILRIRNVSKTKKKSILPPLISIKYVLHYNWYSFETINASKLIELTQKRKPTLLFSISKQLFPKRGGDLGSFHKSWHSQVFVVYYFEYRFVSSFSSQVCLTNTLTTEMTF
jgi:hypothetical protein